MSDLRDSLGATYKFAGFVYDACERVLLRGEEEIGLNPKTKDLLEAFLENPHRRLSRQELADRLWPDTAVTDDALRFQVAELRKALGDQSETLIRTFPREGYRWEVSVEKSERSEGALPPCRLIFEGREVALHDGEHLVGRDPKAALWIDHPSVSRRHFRIVVCGGEARLEDLGSKNGTYVGEKRVEGRHELSHRDEIRVGPLSIHFRVLTGTGTTQTDRR